MRTLLLLFTGIVLLVGFLLLSAGQYARVPNTSAAEQKAPLDPPFKERDKEELKDGSVERPSPERVARRAMVLAMMVYRASLEQFPGQEKYEALHRQLPTWIAKLDLAGELEI